MEIKDYEYVVVPNILRNYKCSSSGECCQNKWRIDIDEIAYNKTKNELEKLSEDIDNYINKNENNQYTTKFARGYCKFITEDKLCRIHRDFGWDCLSDTCKVYPRLLKLTTRGMEMGLVFSCRSSAKLLLTDEKIEIIKVKKEDLFFMKPSTTSFIIPENNLDTVPAYRYYELEEFMIDVMNEKGSISDKFQYLNKKLKELYELEDAKEFDFKRAKEEFKKYKPEKLDGTGVNDIIVRTILAKQEEGAKVVAQEFINLLKLIKLSNDLEKDKDFLRDDSFSLEPQELEELKKLWNKRYDKVLSNYMTCLIFNKDFYYSREFAMMKTLALGGMLKFRILLNTKYMKRELTDDELIYTIKSHDNDFSHGTDFFYNFYNNSKAGVEAFEFISKMLTFFQ